MKHQGQPGSDIPREGLPRYMEKSEWRPLLQYGEEKAREKGIRPEDVAPLVDEYRAEDSSIRS